MTTSASVPTSLIVHLVPRYQEPHRCYHTWSHIVSCFGALELITSFSSLEVTLALLYHDAVYEPLAENNEERSASLLLAEGRRAGIDEEVLQNAFFMILMTKHDAKRFPKMPPSKMTPSYFEQACIVVDADLSILGADASYFDRYEDNIRQEYSMVPNIAFAAGRTKVMQSFLDRKTPIFETPRSRELWEAQARKNLERSVKRWRRVSSSS